MKPIITMMCALFLLVSFASHASQFDAELLRLTNAERTQRGLSALTLNAQLGQAAQHHAADMAQQNYFSHTGKNGSSMGDRVEATGYRYSYAGENIATGQQTPAAVLNAWMNSEGHRKNILSPNFTEIGFGYSYSAQSDYGHYWVQVFGKPMNGSSSSSGQDDDTPFSGSPSTGLTEQQKAEALLNRIERDYQLVANSATNNSDGMYYRFYLNSTAALIVYQGTFYLGLLQTWQFIPLGTLEQANQQYCQSSCW